MQVYNNGMYTGNQYNFNGTPSATKNYHKYTTTQEISYTFAFSYDYNWRPTGTLFTMNGASKQLNTLQYTELGKLKARYLNGKMAEVQSSQFFA